MSERRREWAVGDDDGGPPGPLPDALLRAIVQSDLIDVTPDCVKLIDREGCLRYLNRAGRRALGLRDDDPLGMEWLSLLPPDARPAGQSALNAAWRGATARFPGRSVSRLLGAQRWDNMLMRVAGADGGRDVVLCVSREVTAEREAGDQLRLSEERLTTALHVGGMGVWDYDIVKDTLHCDDQWYRIMGRDPSVPVRCIRDFEPFIHPADRARATEVVQTASQLIQTEQDYSQEFRIIRPNGDVRWVRSAAHLAHVDAQPVRAVGFVIDITEARREELALRRANRMLEEERTALARQSLEDPLTGIPNRRYLDNELARLCARANETGEPVCLGMVDIDHFKAYNDHYGHVAGDDVLRRAAAALQESVRRADFVARYGGEEFAVVLAGTTDATNALDRLAAAVRALDIAHEASPFGRLTVSAGCVVAEVGAGLSPRELLHQGDAALYAAKAAGRNRYVIRPFQPPRPRPDPSGPEDDPSG